jgi:RimJ/RimL family protein N-acetyltransferase
MPSEIRLAPWGDDDLALLEGLLGDPAMMVHLGGPEPAEQIADRHARYLASEDPMFKVLADGEPAGWVGYWAREWQSEPVYEIGWSVLPGFQRRGIARAATARAIDHARAEGARRFVHAFPIPANEASNALCRTLGFTLRGPCDFEHPPGRVIRCNDWRLDLRAVSAGGRGQRGLTLEG